MSNTQQTMPINSSAAAAVIQTPDILLPSRAQASQVTATQLPYIQVAKTNVGLVQDVGVTAMPRLFGKTTTHQEAGFSVQQLHNDYVGGADQQSRGDAGMVKRKTKLKKAGGETSRTRNASCSVETKNLDSGHTSHKVSKQMFNKQAFLYAASNRSNQTLGSTGYH